MAQELNYDPFAQTEVGLAGYELVDAAVKYEEKRERVLGKGFTHVSKEGELFSAAVAKYKKAVGLE